MRMTGRMAVRNTKRKMKIDGETNMDTKIMNSRHLLLHLLLMRTRRGEVF